MNQPEHLVLEHYIRCGKRASNAFKSFAIFGGGFVLTILVYLLFLLIKPDYAAIAGIVTLLASLFSVNALAKYSLTEFEYRVVRGKFEITKVQGRTARKNYITFSAANVLLLQRYSVPALKKLEQTCQKTLDASSYTNYENCWLVLVDIGLGKQVVVIIEPTTEILDLMRYYLNPEKVKG
jgi:hypothetical protein